ncbi:hypothetical protein Q9L42_017685 [Methylomarinum sp. Ch1-1]|uniref:Uncharacterized protein n=1 Tax=Methylomarinum roseum TaxID=3067653 RepID=A0AAU7NT72_9GAMM
MAGKRWIYLEKVSYLKWNDNLCCRQSDKILAADLNIILVVSNSRIPSVMEQNVVAEKKNKGRQINEGTPHPSELIDWLTKPIIRFLRIEATAGTVLLLFTIAALVLSNSAWAHLFLEA